MWTRSGVVLVLALPLLLFLGTGLLFGSQEIDIKIERQLSAERVLPGVPVNVSLRLHNLGKRLESLVITDQLPEGLELISGTTSLLTTLDSGESVELTYTISAKRGFYRFRQIAIVSSDHLGVITKSTLLPAEGRIFVQPEVQRIGRVAIRPRRTRVYAGFIPARRGGPGVEFFGVREYQQGDPQRWINWRASARHQKSLFINQFEQERVADIGIILDTRRRSEVRVDDGQSLFECGVQAAASLADSFLLDGNRVGLLLYGRQLDWTMPGYGKVQRERILQGLARAKLGESMVFGKLENLPERLFPNNAQLVLISPLHSDDLPVLVHLRARGYALLVISPDPIRYELAGLDLADEVTVQAARLARLERALSLHKLRQSGIQVLDWDVELPLDAAIHVSLDNTPPFLNPLEMVV